MINVPFRWRTARRPQVEPDRSRALPGEPGPSLVDAGRWRAALPEDAWPSQFPTDGQVWRRDVFAVAYRWRDGEATARQLLGATLMWTHADSPHGRRRALRTLADDSTGERTEQALDVLRNERLSIADLRAAYLAFRTTCRLREFDGDMATRLLYFAGYRRGGPGVQPLILNDEIAARLPQSSGVSNPDNRGSSLEWLRYVSWAAAQAGEHVEPELVEMDLLRGGLRFGRTLQEVRIPHQRDRAASVSGR
jgi:hypothetical protein